MPTQLSPHFSLAELTVTGAGIPNTPNAEQIANLQALCTHILEPIRAHFGLPVVITSGFRCPAVNARAGGATTSQHLHGQAADIHIPGVDNADLWRFIDASDLPFDQVIAERLEAEHPSAGWVHVSYDARRSRREAISGPTPGHYLPGLHFA